MRFIYAYEIIFVGYLQYKHDGDINQQANRLKKTHFLKVAEIVATSAKQSGTKVGRDRSLPL